jgi:DNA-binding transcriptional ArsR family regulator
MAAEGLPPLDGVAEAIKPLADGTRLRLLMLLGEGEANVGSLCARLKLAQPAVSHHLGLLRVAGLVHDRRQGKNVCYRLAAEAPSPGGVHVVAGAAVITITSPHGGSRR